MNFEEKYYEYEDFWKNENITEFEQQRIIDIINFFPKDVKTILDIGCGNGIFCNYVRKNLKGINRIVGFDRSQTALKYVETEKCIGNVNEIPFSTNEFDLVTALEVIEHLPFETFEMAKKEITRVAKKWIILSVPRNEKLKRNMAECPKCNTIFSRSFHMRSFNEKLLNDLFSENNFQCKKIASIGRYDSYIGLKYFILFYNFLRGTNKAMLNSLCPVCGYTERKHGNNLTQSIKKKTLKKIAKKIWPRFKKEMWLLAIYEKK